MRLSELLATGFAVAALATPVASSAQEAKPGEFKIPGTSTTLKLNGYVEFDATYDFSGADEQIDGIDWATFLPAQPFDNTDRFRKRLYLTARTSRIGLTTSTPTGWGNLGVRVEGDFNSPSPNAYSSELTTNGVGFRLRHAYGELGGLLIGTTWSNFADLGSFPDTVDFNPHGAIALTRQPMIKYTLGFGTSSLALALENPQSRVAGSGVPQPTNNGDNATASTGRLFDRYPDITANLTIPFAMGHLNLRGVAFEYGAYTGTQTTAGEELHQWAWGAGASGSLKFAAETLVWSVQGGDGIGRYTFQTLTQGASVVNGDIELWRSLAYHVGLTHAWSPALRSNIIWTQTFIENNEGAGTLFGITANKRIDALFVNSFYSPVKNMEVGLEYLWGQRIAFSDRVAGGEDTGTQHRANALVRYTFF